MKKFIQNLAAGSIAGLFAILFMFVSAPAASANVGDPGFVPGAMVGRTLTFTNTFDAAADGFYPYYPTKSKIGALVASSNNLYFTCGEHVTQTRIARKSIRGITWMTVNLFDGYNVTVRIPAHETVTIDESLTLPVIIPGTVCLK